MTARYAPFRIPLASIVVLAALVAGVQRGEAHKAVTSKYTYNDDVFPILRERCSQCHVTGGVAPMSLMTYEEAFPWAESIRAELVAAHMPPWNAEDGFGDLKRAHALPPKELAQGELADHSWTHPPLTTLPADAATSEIQRTRDAVSTAAGKPIRMFRPPYGLRNPSIDDTVRRLGMVNVIWNVDSLDSAGADKVRIAATVIANLRPGAIVLMHENRGQTIQALHKILPALGRKKLQAVPLSELLQRDPPSRAQLDRGPDGCPKQTGAVSAGG